MKTDAKGNTNKIEKFCERILIKLGMSKLGDYAATITIAGIVIMVIGIIVIIILG